MSACLRLMFTVARAQCSPLIASSSSSSPSIACTRRRAPTRASRGSRSPAATATTSCLHTSRFSSKSILCGAHSLSLSLTHMNYVYSYAQILIVRYEYLHVLVYWVLIHILHYCTFRIRSPLWPPLFRISGHQPINSQLSGTVLCFLKIDIAHHLHFYNTLFASYIASIFENKWDGCIVSISRVQATDCNFESSTFRDGLYWHSGGTLIVLDSRSLINSKHILSQFCCTGIDECTSTFNAGRFTSVGPYVRTPQVLRGGPRAGGALSPVSLSSSSFGALDEHVACVLAGAPSETFPSSPHTWL